MQNYFDLFVTSVDKVGPMLKIWGQTDRSSSLFVEQLLKNTSEQFERDPVPLQLSSFSVGLLCCAKYKDGHYYRAQITNLRSLVSGVVEVKFIDYGNVELITTENIRLLHNVPIGLSTMKPQALDFILANVMHVNQQWDDKTIAFIHQEIAYIELKCTVVGAVNNFRFLKIIFHDSDLGEYLVQKGIAVQIPLATQEMIIRGSKIPHFQQISPAIIGPRPSYINSSGHVPSLGPSMGPSVAPMQELCSYKTLPLEPNSEHMVYVSYVEDGPYLFSIQLQSLEEVLEKLMIEINQLPLLPLTETPVPGYPCMARCLEDNSLCRAVVINLVEDKCKTYYVDFGNTDVLPFSHIFQIPFKYILPKVMSMRFTLAGLKNMNVTNEMKCAFKEYVTNRLLKLKVLKLEGSPVLQYCELYDGDKNIVNILYESANEYKTIQVVKGMKYTIIVSFIEGCKKFFVQLKESSDSLNKLMLALANACEGSTNLQDFEPGAPCVAFYIGDNQWYRAQILSAGDSTVTVKYVDYGNEDTVAKNCIKKLDPNFVKVLPAQAIQCCLCGYQNMSFNNEIENVFESLTLECEFTMKVINKQNDETLLVDLFDTAGNNVAALLIEKLAAQKSQLGPLPSNKVTRSLVNNGMLQSPTEKNAESPKSPESWRNTANESSWKNAANENKKPRNYGSDKSLSNDKSWSPGGNDKKSWSPGGNDKKSWSPGGNDKKSWSPGGNDKRSWSPGGNEKKSWKTANDTNKKGWRSTDDAPMNNRPQSDNWNGSSPTNKRSFERNDPNERFNARNNRNSRPKDGDFKDYPKKFDEGRKPSQHDFNRGSNNWNSGSESEKSWSGNSVGNRSGKSVGSRKDFKQPRKNDFTKPDFAKSDFAKPNEFRSQSKPKPALPPQDFAPFNQEFKQLELTAGALEKVAISWFYSPETFFCQLLSCQKEFRDLMCEIQTAYNDRLPTSEEIPTGGSVIAEFQDDNILYRAKIIENKYPKYKVQYVDFGNMSLIDCRKIWQVEKKFMDMPVQAVKCGISSVKPAGESWPVSDVMDNIFNKEAFECTFEGFCDDIYSIQLYENEVSVKQQLIEAGLATEESSSLEMLDEPVDLNILIGQNITIRLSFVYGLNKFYVHLEREKATQVEEFIQSFINSTGADTLQKFAEDQITSGVTCLVKTESEKWYRAVIKNNSELNAIDVEYPDYGGCGVYKSDNIYILPQQLCVYWYQGFECTLHNLTENVTRLSTNEKFKEEYEGKDLILYADDVQDGRLIVTLYDTTGTKLELIDPDEGSYPTVDPLCSMPLLNSTLSVWISHTNNATSVYLQRTTDTDKQALLLEKLYKHYDAKEETPSNFTDGDFCCAKSENDSNWYRGRIEKVSDEIVKVLYIDYGNCEELPKANLRTLDSEFLSGHEMALSVSLNLVETSEQFVSKFTEMTANKSLKASIYYGETGWVAELFDDEGSVNNRLVELQLASHPAEIIPAEEQVEDLPLDVEESAPTEEDAKNVPAEEVDESRAQIYITHIDSPSEFYVQLVSNQESILSLQAVLQEQISSLPDLEGADIGVLCAAKYTVDEQWYRAEVLDADSEITTVRFVDYGNTDVITNNEGSIKTLPSDLLAVDKYARKCSLNVMPPKGDEWPQEASQIFENAVNVDTIYADIVYQDEKYKTYVELFAGGVNVAEQLVNSSLAVPITRDAEDSIANNTGFVSHLNSVSEFWIQLESSVPDLEMIAERLANADSFPDLQDLSPGILCAANFPDDEMWYRARILSNTVAGIEVLFVDYGNSSTAMKLKVLPEDLVHMPILAQKCSLNKPANLPAWLERASEKFRGVSADGLTVFTIKKLAAGETGLVELFVDGNNIVDELLDLSEESAESMTERMTPIGEVNYTKALITHIESPAHLWVQLDSDSEKLDEMMENLVAANSFKPLTEWDADTTCAALYEATGIWYRAKILEFVDQYNVLLIDYGNTMFTNNLRALPANVESVPPLAVLCSLEYPEGVSEWTEAACTKFSNAVADGYAESRLEFLDKEVPSMVRLFIDGKNIAEEIVLDAPLPDVESATGASLTSDQIAAMAVNMKLPEPSLDAADEFLEAEEIEKTQEAEKPQKVEEKPQEAEKSQEVEGKTQAAGDSVVDSQGDSVQPTLTNTITSRPTTPHSEKVVPGSFSRGSLESFEEPNEEEIVDISLTDELINEENQSSCSRPMTPHSEKIVPGSICRGDLEKVPDQTVVEVLKKPIKEITEVDNQPNSRPATPHSEKLVPGSVCRGDTSKPSDFIAKETPISRPATPLSEKIVPGSVSRGDLAESSGAVDSETIPETTVILPNKKSSADIFENEAGATRPKTPVEEKIVPGSVSRGVESEEKPDDA